MGSFNKVCSVSGITITHGDEVVQFLVIPSRYKTSTAVDGAYELISFPMYGKYDDYGLVTLNDSIQTNISIEALKDNLDRFTWYTDHRDKYEITTVVDGKGEEHKFTTPVHTHKSLKNIDTIFNEMSRDDIFFRVGNKQAVVSQMLILKSVFIELVNSEMRNVEKMFIKLHTEAYKEKLERLKDGNVYDTFEDEAVADKVFKEITAIGFLSDYFCHHSFISSFDLFHGERLYKRIINIISDPEECLNDNAIWLFHVSVALKRALYYINKQFTPSLYGGQDHYYGIQLEFNKFVNKILEEKLEKFGDDYDLYN